METRDPKQKKQCCKKKNSKGGIKLPDFRQYYKDKVFKIVFYWHTKKKNPEIQISGLKYKAQNRLDQTRLDQTRKEIWSTNI